MNREEFRRMVAEFVQPLRRGNVQYVSGLISELFNLIPFGEKKSQSSYPYGMVSWPIRGVFGFFQSLGGSQGAPVTLGHLDQKRPVPSQEGETIFYARQPDGTMMVEIFLKPDGLLKIVANTKVEVKCDNIELGKVELEKIVNGETFREFYNEHSHYFMGCPVSAPIDEMTEEEHLSSKVKASI